MLKHYFKTLWRNVQKNKLHSVINVAGMAIAFACSILLFLRVYYEYSFDNFFTDSHRLYKLYKYSNESQGQKLSGSISYPAEKAIKQENIGVEKAALLQNGGNGIRYGEKTLENSVTLVGEDFLNMFSFPTLKGNGKTALSSTADVVLTQELANNLFGNENPIGKSVELNIEGDWKKLNVSAVLKKLPSNSSFQFDILARIELEPDFAQERNSWDASSSDMYVELQPNISQKDFEKRLLYFSRKYNSADSNYVKKLGYVRDANGDFNGLKILPMKEVHFNREVGGNDTISKSFIYILLLVAGVILLTAIFNFINLSLGLSFTRGKEIGVRKYLGAHKKQIRFQIWSENYCFILISMLLGLGLAFLLMKSYNNLFGGNIHAALLFNPFIIISLLLLSLIVSVLASAYPSLVLARLKPTEVLKGKISIKRKSGLRNVLIISQFVIAISLICTTIIIYRQFQYLRRAPLGYNTNSLISIPIKDIEHGKSIVAKMRTLLNGQSSIVSVSGSSVNFGLGKDGSVSKHTFGFDYNGKAVMTNFLEADYDIVKTLGIKLIDGRDFTTDYAKDTTENPVIVTESMAKQLADKNQVGLQVLEDSASPKWNVVGVIPDFQLYSMYNKNEPLTISLNPNAIIDYILIRVNTRNPAQTMDMIEGVYKQAEPGKTFTGSYADENVERWYKNEKRLAEMFTVSAIIAIALSCMGLFAISLIVINQRVKEIGVRKILGASVCSITVIVLKEFIKPVIIALIIAVPIALWSLTRWLRNFNYHVSIQWWVFFAAGLAAIIIAFMTVAVQAVRAARANPVKSLKTE